LVSFGVGTLLALPATAQSEDTVRELLRDCELTLDVERSGISDTSDTEEAISVTRCVSLVKGVTSILSYSCWSFSEGFSPMFAAEPPPTVEASIQAFVNYARANPDIWLESNVDGVMGAMMTTFPCSAQLE
jgi:hypothetical protein